MERLVAALGRTSTVTGGHRGVDGATGSA
jgi:hypothetical protein